jgi:lipopolysaccharide cholinephosphotransferase
MAKEIDLEQLKKIELELLVQVDKVCRENNFRYSLGGGTLLGAVRHNGFIPWDDDVDIMMPRPDYDAFINYCKTSSVPFKILSWETDKNYVDLSAKAYNPDTVLIEGNFTFGVNIDIFPIDGLGDTYKNAKKAFKATSFKRELLVAASWTKFFKSKTHPWYYEPVRFIFYVMGKFVNKQRTFKKILNVYSKYDFNNVQFAAPVGGSYREKEIMEQKIYSEYTELSFEGHSFKSISAYDEYLTKHYGNYMQLPPAEKQTSHHIFKAYYKDGGVQEQ